MFSDLYQVQWYQFSSVAQSCLTHCDLMTAAHQASLSITNSWTLVKPMSIESVMPSDHLILCRPLLLPPSIFPSMRIFSNESALCNSSVQFSSVPQSCLTLCNSMTAAHQASLSITSSCSLLKLLSIELVMPSNHLILCVYFSCGLQSFPASGSFPMSQIQ